MAICCALFKDGYSNFSISILEYCSPEKCLERESYYCKFFNPEYNIAKERAPMSGRTHSDDTKKIMSDAHKGKTISDETRKKISDAQPTSQVIEVFDLEENISTIYNSIREAARALNIHKSVIDNYFKNNQKKPYKGLYTFNKK